MAPGEIDSAEKTVALCGYMSDTCDQMSDDMAGIVARISAALGEAWQQSGGTQREFAARLGVSPSHVSRLIGKSTRNDGVGLRLVTRLHQYLLASGKRISLDELVYGQVSSYHDALPAEVREKLEKLERIERAMGGAGRPSTGVMKRSG